MRLKFIQNFIKLETSSGIILLAATLIALIFANSPLQSAYTHFLNADIGFEAGNLHVSASLSHFINECLMAFFFLVVSMEIKRELLTGELRSRSKAALPLFAALGGMIMPALIFILLNNKHPEYLPGWAIPTATDIAFSLGILALLGTRVPLSLKIFLTALAIIDDLGAIIIIALFYTPHLAYSYLALAIVCILLLALLNRLKIMLLFPYLILGLFLWMCILQSGIHATVAGVILGFTIPLSGKKGSSVSPLKKLEKALHPWIAYGILPLFAFANAGLNFIDVKTVNLFNPLPLAIFAGLFFGKQIGIFSAGWLAIKLKFASMPEKTSWQQFYGVAILCGIGFTMSLFINTLAFSTTADLNELVRLGVLAGSLLSGVVGYIILRIARH